MDLFKEKQPDDIPITEELRLRRFDGIVPEALGWYQDRATLRLVDGPDREPYDDAVLARMYRYLEQHGELYYIEHYSEGRFMPIGDVTLAPRDLPIVIGDPRFRGRGIGSKVIRALIARARKLGLSELFVRDIYDYNAGSKRLFQKCGFRPIGKTELGHSYRFIL